MNQLAINLQTTSNQSMEQSTINLQTTVDQSYSLLDLPNEVLINILMYCGAVIKRVCKRLYILVIKSPELANIVYTNYIVEERPNKIDIYRYRIIKCNRRGIGISIVNTTKYNDISKIVKYYVIDNKIVMEIDYVVRPEVSRTYNNQSDFWIPDDIMIGKYIYGVNNMLETIETVDKTLHFSNYRKYSVKYGFNAGNKVIYRNGSSYMGILGYISHRTICDISDTYFRECGIRMYLSDKKRQFFGLPPVSIAKLIANQ